MSPPSEALAHPTWDMGPIVTTNSSTLVNKGLEVIEAHLLFGIDVRPHRVVVHPQSMIHSMVEFTDGSTLAQVSPPDMHLPISLALGWPDRLPGSAAPVTGARHRRGHSSRSTTTRSPALGLAIEAGRTGGVAPAIYNAANEVCVDAFLAGRLGLSRHRRHDRGRAFATTTYPRLQAISASMTCSPPTGGPATRAAEMVGPAATAGGAAHQ